MNDVEFQAYAPAFCLEVECGGYYYTCLLTGQRFRFIDCKNFQAGISFQAGIPDFNKWGDSVMQEMQLFRKTTLEDIAVFIADSRAKFGELERISAQKRQRESEKEDRQHKRRVRKWNNYWNLRDKGMISR